MRSKGGVTKGAEDEIVISGMSGRFPESDSLQELWDNLMSGKDMIKVDDRRWPVGVYEVDTFGKLKDISRFDAPFFNFSPDQANQCAPDIRIMLEVAWEAIVDAGYDPKSLENTPTGVYIGNCIVEAGEALTNNVNTITATGLLNSMHTSLPNKVSEYFKFTGPSETHDTGCSASLYSLDTAVMAMKRGDVSAALIGGCNLNLKPQATIALHRMNMVSGGRGCRVYDISADGYSRAECISLVFLQWRSQARRIYGRIVNSVTNNDGFKEEGIIFPDSKSQISLLKEAYSGTCVKEEDVCYVEAHGTGTQAGDTQECLAVDTFFCSKRKQDKPLLIGSIKSNLGHAEPASGVASLCKVLMSYTRGVVPPNIHLNEINPKLEAVVQGRLKIVTEPTPLDGKGLVSLNAFGFGGSNAHVILLPNDKEDKSPNSDVFFVNGRTPGSVSNLIDLAKREPKRGLQDLYRGLSTISSDLYPYRGYLILNSDGSDRKSAVSQKPSTNRPQVWLLLGGLGSQWVGMGQGLFEFDCFRQSIGTCQTVLDELGADVDIAHILCSQDSDICEDVVSMFIGLSALVIGLLEVLKTADLKFDGVIGHSLGDTLCGLALGLHSVSDVIKSAYARSILIKQHVKLRGSMYGVARAADVLQEVEGVNVACFNSANHVTLAVNSEEGRSYLEQLRQQGCNVRKINSGGFAFHSPIFHSIQEEVTGLMGYMKCVDKPDSWISTTYPADKQPGAVGPSFFADNLVNPVYFQENARSIPEHSTVVELSGNSSLLGLLGGSYHKIGLLRYNQEPRLALLTGIGELYTAGAVNTPYSLLPAPVYPTPRDTPTLSSAVAAGWNHRLQWWVPKLDEFLISSNDAKLNKFVSTHEIGSGSDTLIGKFVKEYSILGRRVIPFSVGVYLAWQSFARANDVAPDNICIQLTNVYVHKQIDLSLFLDPVKLCVGVLPKSGQFHITISDTLFMSGSIETHDPLQECSLEFNPDSGNLADAAKVLAFYQLVSPSNSVVRKVDLEGISCDIAVEKLENNANNAESNLLLLDSHFQLLQLEKMQTSPFSILHGASSIVLDGRGFCETTSVSQPYPGACRSDAVWIEGANFDLLEPLISPAMLSSDLSSGVKINESSGVKINESSGVKMNESSGVKMNESSGLDSKEDSGLKPNVTNGVKLSDNGEDVKIVPRPALFNREAPSIVYSNLLGSSVLLADKTLTVTHIHSSLEGALHVCYASCCQGDMVCCHGDAQSRDLAVGILSKSEVMDSTGIVLSQQFSSVSSQEFELHPDVWSSIAVSLCLLKVLEMNQPESVLVLGDGDFLFSSFTQLLSKRFKDIRQTTFNLNQSPPEEILDKTDPADCVVNLSSEENLLEVLTATNRCGSAVNFLRSEVQESGGMSCLLKNLSVVNFQAGFLKLSSYWTLVKLQIPNIAKDFLTKDLTDFSPFSPNSQFVISDGNIVEVAVHTKCTVTKSVIQDFFHHRSNFRLSYCKEACERHKTYSKEHSKDIIGMFCNCNESVILDDVSNSTPIDSIKFTYAEMISPLAIRAWLTKHFIGLSIETDSAFVLRLTTKCNNN